MGPGGPGDTTESYLGGGKRVAALGSEHHAVIRARALLIRMVDVAAVLIARPPRFATAARNAQSLRRSK